MKTLWALTIVGVISGAAVPSASAAGAGTLVITSSNAANNTLLVYDTQGTLLQALPTGGNGGVGGNAGGIAASRDAVAVVNFGSGTVTIFRRGDNDLALDQELTTASTRSAWRSARTTSTSWARQRSNRTGSTPRG